MGSCICLPMIPRSTPLARTLMISFQSVVDQSHTWCLSNRLVAHESKSKAVIISNQVFVGLLTCLRYGNSTIEYTVSCKCLGVTIDNRLSWQEHTKNVCDSFSKKVAVLKRINSLPNLSCKQFITKQFFQVSYMVL